MESPFCPPFPFSLLLHVLLYSLLHIPILHKQRVHLDKRSVTGVYHQLLIIAWTYQDFAMALLTVRDQCLWMREFVEVQVRNSYAYDYIPISSHSSHGVTVFVLGCNSSFVQCPSSMDTCVSRESLCDGQQDCPSNIDEGPFLCGKFIIVKEGE